MISTLAGYVDQALDRVTDGYLALRDHMRPPRRLTLEEARDGAWVYAGRVLGSGSQVPSDADLVLVLDPSKCLVLTLPLPLGAKPYLRGVIASQIDRISPWPADRAIFGAAITDETSAGLIVRIAVASRADIGQRVNALGAIGARSITLRVPTDLNGIAVPIDLDFETAKQTARSEERRKISAIFFGAIALVILTELSRLALGSSVENTIRQTRADIAKLRETIAGAALGDLKSDPLARMVNAKSGTLPTVEVLDALSSVVPDHTYLTALEIEPGKIHIEGISTAVTDLPKAIGENPAFGEVSFSAPTAKRRDGAGETFQIDIALKARQETAP